MQLGDHRWTTSIRNGVAGNLGTIYGFETGDLSGH